MLLSVVSKSAVIIRAQRVETARKERFRPFSVYGLRPVVSS